MTSRWFSRDPIHSWWAPVAFGLLHLMHKYRQLFKNPCMVYCDYSPFRGECKIFKFNGTFKAKRHMRRWVRKHPWGQAQLTMGTTIRITKRDPQTS